ncbi:protein of unknown function [Magnetospirillum gryphiswaldense MSR-1 v2]|uniref:Uncharacterized protein n=1 Tax=Magnetospirillum gryphiswaldense (strain DSM 6361 / JCM 21280 / NBRC 15271 / MSR-1) TaxID=431944 RepID=V6F3B0_MAGGM|nr:protein of unknown function [Magnetospirillum gryphiswaldense MSR-1 v2]
MVSAVRVIEGLHRRGFDGGPSTGEGERGHSFLGGPRRRAGVGEPKSVIAAGHPPL